MTRFRAFVAVNVLLAIFAFVLISTGRKDTLAVDVRPGGISTLSSAELQAALARMSTMSVESGQIMISPTTPAVAPAPVKKPVRRPKPAIA